MGIDIVWDDPDQTIVRWDFGREWTRADFKNAFNTTLQMARSVDGRIDVIPFIRHTPTVPQGILSDFGHIDRYISPNVGLVVVTGGNTFGQLLIDTFKRIYKVENWITAPTLEDARRVIHADRVKEA